MGQIDATGPCDAYPDPEGDTPCLKSGEYAVVRTGGLVVGTILCPLHQAIADNWRPNVEKPEGSR